MASSVVGQFGSCLKGRHPEAPRFHQRGEGSGAKYFKLTHHRQLSSWKDEAEEARIWQPRFYDFNVQSEGNRTMWSGHSCPLPLTSDRVAANRAPEPWAWSSFRHYFRQESGTARANDRAAMELKIRPPAA